MATLIASVIGTGVWLLGISRRIWPAHPMLAVLLVTIGALVAVRFVWPHDGKPAAPP